MDAAQDGGEVTLELIIQRYKKKMTPSAERALEAAVGSAESVVVGAEEVGSETVTPD